MKRFQFKGLSPNFHLATLQNIHKILEIVAHEILIEKVSTTMIFLDMEFVEMLTKEIFGIFGNIL